MSEHDPRYWTARVALLARAGASGSLLGFTAEKLDPEEPFENKNVEVSGTDWLFPGTTVVGHQHLGYVRGFNGIPAADGAEGVWGPPYASPDSPETIVRGNVLVVRSSKGLVFSSGITGSWKSISLVPDAGRLMVSQNVALAANVTDGVLQAFSAYTDATDHVTATLSTDDELLVRANLALAALKSGPVYAFHALEGRWIHAENLVLQSGDVCRASTNVALVAQPGSSKLHVFSAVRQDGWQTLENFPLGTDTIYSVRGNVALVARPSNDEVHAYSAITGIWSSLKEHDETFTSLSDDEYLAGYDAWDVEIRD